MINYILNVNSAAGIVCICVQANVPFSEWFEVEAVQQYHKALAMEDFLTQLAPQYWPQGQRAGYCYR